MRQHFTAHRSVLRSSTVAKPGPAESDMEGSGVAHRMDRQTVSVSVDHRCQKSLEKLYCRRARFEKGVPAVQTLPSLPLESCS